MKEIDCSSLFSVSSSGAIMSDSVRAEFQAPVPTVLPLNNFCSSESGFNGTATDDSGPVNGFRLRVNSRTAVVDGDVRTGGRRRVRQDRPARARPPRLLQRPRQNRPDLLPQGRRLKSHPDVYDVLVAGAPDERWGNLVAFVIQLREGAAPLALAAVQAHCRARPAGYRIPRAVVLTDRIQRSPSGKADYRWARPVVAACPAAQP